MLSGIISGGEVGVEIAALRAAREAGLRTGGWMAKGWRTEAGAQPDYAQEFGLQELDTADFDVRSARNIRAGRALLLLCRSALGPGMKAALNAARRPGDSRPYYIVEWSEYEPRRVLETHRDAAVRFLCQPQREIVTVIGARDQFVEEPVQSWLEGVLYEVKRLQ